MRGRSEKPLALRPAEDVEHKQCICTPCLKKLHAELIHSPIGHYPTPYTSGGSPVYPYTYTNWTGFTNTYLNMTGSGTVTTANTQNIVFSTTTGNK